MACSDAFVQSVLDALAGVGALRSRKMFGDWMVYVDGKPAVLCCDNVAYLKKLPCLAPLLAHAEEGVPYEGARPHYALDPGDAPAFRRAVEAALPALSVPRPRAPKKK